MVFCPNHHRQSKTNRGQSPTPSSGPQLVPQNRPSLEGGGTAVPNLISPRNQEPRPAGTTAPVSFSSSISNNQKLRNNSNSWPATQSPATSPAPPSHLRQNHSATPSIKTADTLRYQTFPYRYRCQRFQRRTPPVAGG